MFYQIPLIDTALAEQRQALARTNAEAWWQEGPPARRPIRVAVAAALVTLAARLDPALPQRRTATPPAPAAPA